MNLYEQFTKVSRKTPWAIAAPLIIFNTLLGVTGDDLFLSLFCYGAAIYLTYSTWTLQNWLARVKVLDLAKKAPISEAIAMLEDQRDQIFKERFKDQKTKECLHSLEELLLLLKKKQKMEEKIKEEERK